MPHPQISLSLPHPDQPELVEGRHSRQSRNPTPLSPKHPNRYNRKATRGGMAERMMAAVLKTVIRATYRGFESHSLRHNSPYAPCARAAAAPRGARASKNSNALTAYSPANTSNDSVYPPVRSTIQPRNRGESIIPAL